MVLGMDAATLKWLEPLITVYTEQPQIDIQLASPEVLAVLSTVDSALIDSYITARVENAKNNLPSPPPPLNAGQSTVAGEVTAFTIISEVRRDDESSIGVECAGKKIGRWFAILALSSVKMTNLALQTISHYFPIK